jgi:16S rRNA (adenine1518-N6/adenine1519-N6)-dimethyltransferase
MPGASSGNQTLSFLMRRFAEAGIHPRTKLGQNFLIDLNLQRLLLDSAEVNSDEVVLEVGTGTGSLTVLLAAQAASVVTVEVDQELARLAARVLAPLKNVSMVRVDVLKNKNRLNAPVLEEIARHRDAAPTRRLKLVANLPYSVATPIVTNLLTEDEPPVSMTVTIQKELADRIIARPGTKDYSALSIWLQSQCRVQIVRVMPPTAFWPRPKVHSAIVRLDLDEQLRGRIADRKFFHTFVRSMFFHRRKYLRSELLAAFKNRLGKPEVDRIMAEQGLDGQIRAERLDVEAMIGLSDAVRGELDA